MDKLFQSIRVKEEGALLKFFEETFNLNAIHSLLDFKEKESPDNFLPFYMRGYYLPVYEEFGGNIYDVCRKVSGDLGFSDKDIEFYVSNDPNFNSSSIFRDNKENAHIVIINRGLIEKVSPEELSFVIGHEIGHLIYYHSYVSRVIQFVYPSYDNLPPFLQKLYDVWSKLCEISADRLGLLACKDLQVSIRGLFKLSSGLEDRHFNLNFENLLKIVDRTFTEMKQFPSYISTSHPANPVRIKALLAFYESDLWKSIVQGSQIEFDEILEEKINEIFTLIKRAPLDEQEENELLFLASAGLVLIGADKKVTEEEYDGLVNILSLYIHWPYSFIEDLQKGEVTQILKDSAEFIVKNQPWRTKDMLKNLFIIINRDRKIRDSELEIFLKIGVETLKMPPSVVVDIFLDGVRNLYKPLY